MSRTSKWLLAGFAVFSLIGFLDAVYLTVQHYNNGILPCLIFSGCDKVTSSSYAKVAGIPVSLLGAGYYFIVLVSTILYFDTGNKKVLEILKNLPIAGFAATLWFLFLQFFIIKAICFYCVVSAIISTALFVLAILIRKTGRVAYND
ncbi:MAG: vitamin K epoxide reductase family protein [Candidatus Yanofskybacteria bacterium]|nr:vitamin K epoxide reductase family protein [Candidatus Yanofskybacteria bacterium]